MSDIPRAIVRPGVGTSPEEAHDTRARAWSFVFQCWQEKQRAGVGPARDDRKGVKNDPDTSSIPE